MFNEMCFQTSANGCLEVFETINSTLLVVQRPYNLFLKSAEHPTVSFFGQNETVFIVKLKKILFQIIDTFYFNVKIPSSSEK